MQELKRLNLRLPVKKEPKSDEHEKNKEVFVATLCGGPFKRVSTVQGYGGIAVQECTLGNDQVTVIYGHIRPESAAAQPGQYLLPGQRLAILGDAFSADTSGERKHLHLGIRRGTETSGIRGYVRSEAELAQWIDARMLIR